MISAIQVHPHDIRDEGAQIVVDNITRIGKINIISPEVSALDERHPYPHGALPHNPARKTITSTATLEIPIDFRGSLPFQPRLSVQAKRGEDYIEELSKAALNAGCVVVPWIKGLNAAFEGDIEPFCVHTAAGESVPTWLCPSKPETSIYVSTLVRKVIERYDSQTILLDRMRYPDWSGDGVAPERMFACFCPDCRRLMKAEGIDVEAIIRLLRRESLTTVLSKSEINELFSWLAFRRKQITRLVGELRKNMRTANPNVKLWLNLWPPSFASLLGQDYSALGKLCDGAKHFPYHKLGGGADLKGLVESLHTDKSTQESTFSQLLKFLGLPYDIDMTQFAKSGFPVDFVRFETAKACEAFHGTPIYSGIQIWNIDPKEICSACEAAVAGGADGFFFYCYGWASIETLRESGRVAELYAM
jgi:hypothetical protein